MFPDKDVMFMQGCRVNREKEGNDPMPSSFGQQGEPVFLAEDVKVAAKEDTPLERSRSTQKPRESGPPSKKRSRSSSRRSDPVRLNRSEILLTTAGFFLLGGLVAAGILALVLLRRGSIP